MLHNLFTILPRIDNELLLLRLIHTLCTRTVQRSSRSDKRQDVVHERRLRSICDKVLCTSARCCVLVHSVIEQLGGKQLVMQHLTHEDPNVRYEALLAVQKVMVHNW